MTDPDATLFPDGDTPLLLVTNRWNLVEILSSGLVLPPAALRKHYRDLMTVSGGWVPLLPGPVDEDTIALVTIEDPATAFPVALEVDPLPSGAVAGPRDTSGRPAVWVTDKVVTLAGVKRVHFRTSDERDEHELRGYDNVVSTLESAVSPELFSAPPDATATARAWLEERQPRTFDTSLHGALDRIAGGALAAAGLTDSGSALEVAAGTASAIATSGPPLHRVATALADHLTAESGEVEAEHILTAAVLETLAEVDPADAWDALAVLDNVKARIAGDRNVTSRIERNLEPIGLVLKNERDFNRFKPSAGLSAAKAFFLVLMRPEPDRVTSWDPGETGATATTRGVAAFLAGFLRGRTLLSREHRQERLDEGFRDNLAARLNGEPIPHKVATATVDGGVALTVDGCVVAHSGPVHPPLGELIRSRSPLDETATSLALTQAMREGWDDCIQTTVEATGEVSLTPLAKGRTRITVSGVPTVAQQIDSQRLAARADNDPCDSDAAAALRTYLASLDPTPSGKKGPRRKR